MSKPAAFCIIAVMTLFSCVRPSAEERFIKSSSVQDGLYSFELDFTDSLATYDIFLYSRSEARFGQQFAVSAEWVGPGGEVRLAEKVWMDSGARRGARLAYRAGVKVSDYGIWTLNLRPETVPEGFCGLGVISERNDGAR